MRHPAEIVADNLDLDNCTEIWEIQAEGGICSHSTKYVAIDIPSAYHPRDFVDGDIEHFRAIAVHELQ